MKKSKLRQIIREEINEITKPDSLWRNTSWKWLYEFLKRKTIKASKNRFISFSLDKDSGSMDVFGKTQIEFDKKLVFKQGGIEIWYENGFFEKYPDICMYVTGYENEEDYYDDKDLSGKEEAIASYELDWDTYIEGFEHEEEVVSKKLKYVDGLIKNVKFDEKPNKKLFELLDKYRINYKKI